MDIFKNFQKIIGKVRGISTPKEVPASYASTTRDVSKDDAALIRKFGLTYSDFSDILAKQNLVNYDRYNIYQEITRSLSHPLMSAAIDCYADTSCLTGDTRVPLLDGRVLTISEIVDENANGVDHYLYSCNNIGIPKVEKLLHAIKQPYEVEVYRIHLDNGKYVDASYNHIFVRRDGSMCRADELIVGESLLPFHRSLVSAKGRKYKYEYVYDTQNHRWKATHVFAAVESCGIDVNVYNRNLKDGDDKLCVHHKDFRSTNNNPSNLKVMTGKRHSYTHSITSTIRNFLFWAKMTKGERSEFISKCVKKRKENGHDVPWNKGKLTVKTCDMCGKHYSNKNSWRTRFCSTKCMHDSYKDRIVLKCNTCGNDFEVIRSENDRKYCSRACIDVATSERLAGVGVPKEPSYNHKIVNIERIGKKFVYDISIAGSHIFALDCGIYTHNTTYSQMHDATVWITSKSKVYSDILSKFLSDICIEEKIYDMAWSMAGFGDHMVKIYGSPGIGIEYIDDTEHAINLSRVDFNGRLIGFFNTPLVDANRGEQKIMEPWRVVHFRCLGAKVKRPVAGDPTQSEFASLSIMAPDKRQASSRYGTCMPRGTMIDTDIGIAIKIADIVDKRLKVKVMSYNMETAKMEWKNVVGYAKRKRDNSENIVCIGCGSSCINGNGSYYIRCTPDHLVLSKGNWVPSKDLKIGDTVVVRSPILSKQQKQVILGHVLGDGGFKNRKVLSGYYNNGFCFTQSDKKVGYYDWNVKNFSNIPIKEYVRHSPSRTGEKYPNGNLIINTTKTFITRQIPALDNIYRISNKDGKKVITEDLLNMLDVLGIATWFMDDGSVILRKGKNKIWRGAVLCTDSFSIKECEEICKMFKDKYGIECHVKNPYSGNGPRVFFNGTNFPKLEELIKDYVKIDGGKKVWVASDIEIGNADGFIDMDIRSVSVSDPYDKWVYDIEVEDNHNFVVNSVVVHNSVVLNGLPVYKRLRLAEDSLMLARLSRGILRYIYKINVTGSNSDAIIDMIDEYKTLLKRARSMDTSSGGKFFEEKYCLTGDTKVRLLDGKSVVIKEMADNKDQYIGKYVYSVNPKTLEFEPDKIINVQKTRLDAELVRVHLDNAKYVDCTPDHPFMMRDGSFVYAKDLLPGSSLMPLYTRKTKYKSGYNGYEMVYDPANKKYMWTHRIVIERMIGRELVKGECIHHKNFVKTNNDPSNLSILSDAEHNEVDAVRHYYKKRDKDRLAVLNHKVVRVEILSRREDTYDITTERNHNFSLDVGIFVHNSPLSVSEDVIVPVWGDTNNITIDKIGGEVDIRWIVDIEELRNQLSCALRVPLQILGGYASDMPQGLGSGAIEKYDIRFARQARRVQRGIIDGITRMCQIHLAYLGMDPDTSLFEVHMPETSMAEEEELKDSLSKGADVVEKMMNLISDNVEGVDKKKVMDYFNQKIFKLDDFAMYDMMIDNGDEDDTKKTKESREPLAEKYKRNTNGDILAALPINKGINEDWSHKFGEMKVKLDEVKK